MRSLAIGFGLVVSVAFIASLSAEESPAPKSKVVKKKLTLIKKAEAVAEEAAAAATHDSTAQVKITGASGMKLQTFCLSPEGNIIAVVGMPRGYSGTAKSEKKAEIQIYSPEGEKLSEWATDFSAQSVNCNAEGQVLVCGDGVLARFDSQGKLLAQSEAPHLAAHLADKESLRKKAEEQLEAESSSYKETLKSLQDDKKELDAKDPKELTKAEKARLKQLEANIKVYEQVIEQRSPKSLDQYIESMTARLRIINACALSDKDVFYTCSQPKGYGYTLWRVSYDFKEPTEVTTGLSGCCGQMDVQCCNGNVYAAENSRHRIVGFDRDGKKLAAWGNAASRVASPGDAAAAETAIPALAKFGGCCNPMNIRFNAEGEVFTAESEGYVKQFSAEGKFIRLVGRAKVSGGCKNVAVAVSPKGDRVYFYDQTNSQVVVLTRSAEKTTAAK